MHFYMKAQDQIHILTTAETYQWGEQFLDQPVLT